MTKKIYILGAGAQARETQAIYSTTQKDNVVKGFIVQKPFIKKQGLGVKIPIPVYDESVLPKVKNDFLVICAIGSPLRKVWVEELERRGIAFDTLVHPTVSKGERISIGKGCIVSPGVILSCDITIGNHTIINVNTSINHDASIGDFVTIGPGVNIAGNVTIGDGSWIGIGSTIVQNVSIGKGTFIAAGAVVVDTIADNTLAMGIPAKPVRRIDETYWETRV